MQNHSRKAQISNIIVSLLAGLSALSSLPALAAEAQQPLSQASSFAAEVPLRQLGGLALKSGALVMADNLAEVQVVPDGLFDRRAVLSGAVVKFDQRGEGDSASVSGIIYFFDGVWLHFLDSQNASEMIETTDGAKISGHIIDGDQDSVVMRSNAGSDVRIAFASMSNIQAARAFAFSFPSKGALEPSPLGRDLGGTAAAVLRPTLSNPSAAPLITMSKTKLPGDEHGISNRSMAALIFLDFCSTIAPAIVAPVVLGHHLNGAKTILQEANLRNAAGK